METYKINVGGLSQQELMHQLVANNVSLNPLAEQLLNSADFQVRKSKEQVTLVATTVGELGLKQGGTLPAIFKTAQQQELNVCDVDVAPFLRLQLQEQQNSHGLKSTHKAPDTSLTVASKILNNNVEFPKGFYLRKVDNVLWLRGYQCDDTHVFDAADVFIFTLAQ